MPEAYATVMEGVRMAVRGSGNNGSVLNAVILAGGSGTRLWPLSRAGNPKFLHPLTGTPDTLLQATALRLAPLARPQETFVVTGAAHAAAVARQLPQLPDGNILVEPSPRDSCAATGLAAALIELRAPGSLMGSFAADHLIRDDAKLAAVVREAMAGAEQGLLMTVGITPTRPETGYGYLHCGETIDGNICRVVEFREKPSVEVAKEYLASGRYLWNACMFVWRTDVFLDALRRQQPALHAGLTEIAAVWDSSDREKVLADVWPELPKISVDYAVMEGAAAQGMVATVPADFGWHDVGDFDTLGEALPRGDGGNVVLGAGDDVLLNDVTDSIVVTGSGRLVAALGLHDVIIVDTPDALLVCPRERAQDVKKLVDHLKARGSSMI
jgi:mannose-1-phosphate guanylyltransferase